MKIALWMVIAAFVAVVVFVGISQKQQEDQALQRSYENLDRVIAGQPQLADQAPAWYVAEPGMLVVVVLAIASIIGLLAAIVLRLERK